MAVLTYDRWDYAARTISSLAKYLRWSSRLVVHIADDGSADEYRQCLAHLASDAFGLPVRTSNSERRGYGASYNLAMQQIHPQSTWVLPLEDDWECLRLFDAEEFVRPLREGWGCVRLGYLGFLAQLRAEVLNIDGATYLHLDPTSAEHHIAAGHPRLETVRWARAVGPWTEGLDPGSTEREWCGRPAARQRVLWPLNLRPVGDLFAHIGSIQARADQR